MRHPDAFVLHRINAKQAEVMAFAAVGTSVFVYNRIPSICAVFNGELFDLFPENIFFCGVSRVRIG